MRPTRHQESRRRQERFRLSGGSLAPHHPEPDTVPRNILADPIQLPAMQNVRGDRPDLPPEGRNA